MYLPRGVYNLTNSLRWPAGGASQFYYGFNSYLMPTNQFEMFGDGPGTVIDSTSNTNSILYHDASLYTNNISRSYIHDLTMRKSWECTNVVNAATNCLPMVHIYATNTCGAGESNLLNVVACWITVKDVEFYGGRQQFAITNLNMNTLSFENCYFGGFWEAGYYGQNADQVTFEKCYFYPYGLSGDTAHYSWYTNAYALVLKPQAFFFTRADSGVQLVVNNCTFNGRAMWADGVAAGTFISPSFESTFHYDAGLGIGHGFWLTNSTAPAYPQQDNSRRITQLTVISPVFFYPGTTNDSIFYASAEAARGLMVINPRWGWTYGSYVGPRLFHVYSAYALDFDVYRPMWLGYDYHINQAGWEAYNSVIARYTYIDTEHSSGISNKFYHLGPGVQSPIFMSYPRDSVNQGIANARFQGGRAYGNIDIGGDFGATTVTTNISKYGGIAFPLQSDQPNTTS